MRKICFRFRFLNRVSFFFSVCHTLLIFISLPGIFQISLKNDFSLSFCYDSCRFIPALEILPKPEKNTQTLRGKIRAQTSKRKPFIYEINNFVTRLSLSNSTENTNQQHRKTHPSVFVVQRKLIVEQKNFVLLLASNVLQSLLRFVFGHRTRFRR